ncbi:MAG: efflux RND transporter periplasmic adaptor subunit [Pirellulaceae bacterium]
MSPFALLLVAAALTGDPTLVETPARADAEQPFLVDSVLLTLVEQVEVPAREAGVLAKINVREGQIVSQGLQLAQIDDTEARIDLQRAALEAAEAKRLADNDVLVRVARKTYEVAQVELKRADETRDRFSKTISQSELDERRLRTEKSELEVEQAEHQFKTAGHLALVAANDLELAQRNVERRRIVSPLDGVLVKVYRRPGEWVEPGEPVLRVVRINPLRAEAFVDARMITGDLTDRPVRLLVELPGRGETSFAGRLVFVSPEIDPFNGQVRVWAEIENRDHLLSPGLRAHMQVLPADSKPAEAVEKPESSGAAAFPDDGLGEAPR